MRWANFFHVYQPPRWPQQVIRRVVRESYRPLISFLLAHRSIHVTLNVSGSLSEQLMEHREYHDILRGIRRLLERHQIELTESAMYHAILPLLPVREIERQVALNHAVNRRAFGHSYHPCGFFPPEMAYSPRIGDFLKQKRFAWVVLDPVCATKPISPDVRYRLPGRGPAVAFRNRPMSDYLAFSIQMQDLPQFSATVQRLNGQQRTLITGMDGENLGHHRHETKGIWQRLVRLPFVETCTVSTLLTSLPDERRMRLKTASWSSQAGELRSRIPFSLWNNPRNRLHRLQWTLFRTVERLIDHQERQRALPASIRREFDQAVASDWYWWASREPWWDVGIIVAAADRLRVLGDELSSGSPRIREYIHSVTAEISAIARQWQGDGSAQRHAARFLRGETTPRYLGGKSVHYENNNHR